MTDLKPCPFCGHATARQPYIDPQGLICIDCDPMEGGCNGNTGFYTKIVEASAAWNRNAERR